MRRKLPMANQYIGIFFKGRRPAMVIARVTAGHIWPPSTKANILDVRYLV